MLNKLTNKFLHRHTWEVVSVADITFTKSSLVDGSSKREIYTTVVSKCIDCGELITCELEGHHADNLLKKEDE